MQQQPRLLKAIYCEGLLSQCDCSEFVLMIQILLYSYKFKVCDSLLNIGPIAEFAIGESLDSASVSMMVRFAAIGVQFIF